MRVAKCQRCKSKTSVVWLEMLQLLVALNRSYVNIGSGVKSIVANHPIFVRILPSFLPELLVFYIKQISEEGGIHCCNRGHGNLHEYAICHLSQSCLGWCCCQMVPNYHAHIAGETLQKTVLAHQHSRHTIADTYSGEGVHCEGMLSLFKSHCSFCWPSSTVCRVCR